MKFLILIILMTCTLKSIDKDKDRFEFIDKFIKNPENYEKIIKESKYFDERVSMNFDKDFILVRVNYIKTYFYKEEYEVVSDTVYHVTGKEKNKEYEVY